MNAETMNAVTDTIVHLRKEINRHKRQLAEEMAAHVETIARCEKNEAEIDRLARLCKSKDAEIVKFQSAYAKQYRATDKLLEDNDRLEVQLAMQAEALKEIAEYNGHSTAMLHVIANQALSATSETVAAWRAKETEPLRREVAVLRDAIQQDVPSYTRAAINNTQATALAYEQEVKAKALEDAASKFPDEIANALRYLAMELRANKGDS